MTMEFEIEIINPAKHPELAAQQVVIELIRAGKIDNSFNGIKALNTYQTLVEKYKALTAEPVDVVAEDSIAVVAVSPVTASGKLAAVAVKEKNGKSAAAASAKAKTSVPASAVKEPVVTAKPVAKPKKAKPTPSTPKKK